MESTSHLILILIPVDPLNVGLFDDVPDGLVFAGSHGGFLLLLGHELPLLARKFLDARL